MGEILPREVDVTPVGVLNINELSDDVIRDSLRAVGEFESRKDWIKGDLLREYETRHPEAFKQLDSDQMEFEFAASFAVLEVSKSIPINHRELSLSFAHHREIAIECESISEIDDWLKKARDNEWSLTELRRNLRKRKLDPSKSGRTEGSLEWLAGFETAAKGLCRRDVSQLQPSERELVKQTLAPVVRLYEQLDAEEDPLGKKAITPENP